MSVKHTMWKAIAWANELLRGPSTIKPGLRLLTYHSIGSELPNDVYGLSSSVEDFKYQMKMISEKHFGLTTSLGHAQITDTAAEISITFDDGYSDTLTVAAPIMTKLGLPFTVCVTPGLIDQGSPYMSWDELRQLSKIDGCEIGAHGLTHIPLDQADDAKLKTELEESRHRLEDFLGSPIRLMTWPHGAANKRSRNAALAAGYVRAACSLYGVNTPSRDCLLLKRTEITGFDSLGDFTRKASGGWDWYSLRQRDPLSL